MTTQPANQPPLALPAYSRIFWLDAVGSTNDYAVSLLTEQGGAVQNSLGFLSLVATGNQEQGKGRMGRSWVAPAGTSLSTSVIVRPEASGGELPVSAYHWVTMIMALAAVDTLGKLGVKGSSIKWPNDVLVGEKKICGVLAQLVTEPQGTFALVVGIGTNVSLEAEDLPVPTATSILLETGQHLALEAVLEKLATRFAELISSFVKVAGDPHQTLEGRGSLLDLLRAQMSTLGQDVRVHLPDGATETGQALDITEEGELIVQTATGQQTYAVGDIIHLRPCSKSNL